MNVLMVVDFVAEKAEGCKYKYLQVSLAGEKRLGVVEDLACAWEFASTSPLDNYLSSSSRFLPRGDVRVLPATFKCSRRLGSIPITLRSAKPKKRCHIQITIMQLEERSSAKLRLQCYRVFMPLKRCRAPNPCLPYPYDAIPIVHESLHANSSPMSQSSA